MVINKCRVCGNDFFKTPLLTQVDMPKSAQYLPGENEVENDKGIDLTIYQCSGCGLVQLSNEPVPYYREVIRAASFSEEVKDFRKTQFEKLIKKFELKNKKVVEIGCGCGDFLSVLQEFEVKCYGLEYSQKSVARCIKKGLKVFQGFIENSNDKLKEAPFDFFYILNYLEHLPNPNSTIRGIYNNLTDNGMGLVEVPNFDMILRKNLFSEFIPDHLVYFTRESLITLLNNNGFEIIECNEERYEYVISVVVKKRKQFDISNFKKYQARVENDINIFIKQFGNRKVAIWGAGHQALAIISLMNLSDKIKYVIDSATFKQNKYTPASHIKIVRPETLESNRIEAIIIMAAAYSDEIAKIIRQKFDKNIEIAILRDFGLEIFS
jgi:2-polyprenyl-3-methyl-5-hydroxy-6-metoxy-1,4-benzoquinol methylase